MENSSQAEGQLAAELGLLVGATSAPTIRGTGALTPLMGLGRNQLKNIEDKTSSICSCLFSVCVFVHLFWPAQHMSLWSSDTHLEHACLLLLNKNKKLAVSFSALRFAFSAQAAVKFRHTLIFCFSLCDIYEQVCRLGQATQDCGNPQSVEGLCAHVESKGGGDPCREMFGHCVSD